MPESTVTREVAVAGAEPIRPGACRVIAEAGVNHNNRVEQAIELARRAAEAGAWGIKYQLYKADTISVPDSPKYWSDQIGTPTQYEAFRKSDKLDYGVYREIHDACRELGIVFFATPFDLAAVDALEAIETPIYKIASGDLTFKPLIEAVAATGKPVLLSTGAATREEIEQAIGWSGLGPDKLVLLVCTLAYPTDDADGHFARIPAFAEAFDPYLVGMSDHTLGPDGAAVTAALGGVCIEKHYTLDKGLPDVPDHKISVEPSELAEMVRAADRAALMRGESWIGVRPAEEPARANARRSIVTERDIAAGAEITLDDLGYKRPGSGLAPALADEVVGRRAARDLPRGTILDRRDLD
jgi:sialic acid synthase SpsE